MVNEKKAKYEKREQATRANAPVRARMSNGSELRRKLSLVAMESSMVTLLRDKQWTTIKVVFNTIHTFSLPTYCV